MWGWRICEFSLDCLYFSYEIKSGDFGDVKREKSIAALGASGVNRALD